jgi:ribonuclease P protein component
LDQTPFKLVTLRRRAEFLRIRGGGRSATPRFVLEGKRRVNGETLPVPRFGFTVTKQMGNAVVRNRIKRRLRAALGEAGSKASGDFDYVIIARTDAFGCDYQLLVEDFIAGFDRVHRTADSPKPREKSGKARR